jgi:hypothetical protein
VIGAKNDPEMNRVCEASNLRYVEALEKLAPAGCMFFIPGNHDAESLFDTQSAGVFGKRKTRNVHLKVVKLRPDLYLAGMGGSIPTLY